MPHLHLSLQAGDDLILKRMKRRHSRDDAIRFCAEMRAPAPGDRLRRRHHRRVPDRGRGDVRTLRSTLIEDCDLSYVHVFPYSARPGTPAARMPQLPGPLVAERAARLREAAQRPMRAHLRPRIGRPLTVLTERGNTGRAEDFTLVRFSGEVRAGRDPDRDRRCADGRALLAELTARGAQRAYAIDALRLIVAVAARVPRRSVERLDLRPRHRAPARQSASARPTAPAA